MKGALIVMFLLTVAVSALARDPDGRYAGSANEPWFKQQHNAQGQWCCDESDGHPFFGGYGFNPDGSVRR